MFPHLLFAGYSALGFSLHFVVATPVGWVTACASTSPTDPSHLKPVVRVLDSD